MIFSKKTAAGDCRIACGSIAPYPTVYPEGSRIRLTWHSVNSSVAGVDASGRR